MSDLKALVNSILLHIKVNYLTTGPGSNFANFILYSIEFAGASSLICVIM